MKRRKKNHKKKPTFLLIIFTILIFAIGIPIKKFITNKYNLAKSSAAYATTKNTHDDKSTSPNTTSKEGNNKDNKVVKNETNKNNIDTSNNKSTNSIVNTNTPVKDRSFFNNSVFLGDSITEGMSFYEVLDESHVVAKKGLTVFKAEKELAKVMNLNPKNIYILLGNNDLFEETLTSKQFITEYTKMVKTLRKSLPQSNIYILSILPVTSKAEKENPFLNNHRIDDFNNTIKNMAKDLNVTYIDIKPVLNNSEQLYEPDGIHFKCDFYNLLLNYLINYLKNN
ncbi:GDSL-type esterase/lipase family protein [Clostridium lundense]|uniref:GDSL-type esterase/lipase family protein n=1 Tax=Clostridium lundense TaxID=319475 RepID=UPI000687585A|nr:GDSL-type esterase/lipase family protein [Clostridium lundense]